MKNSLTGKGALAILLVAAAAGGAVAFLGLGHDSKITVAVAAPAAAPAVPVTVAAVERRDLVAWQDFSGRLEAVDTVEVRARVAGQVQAVHFREGGLVKKGDVLVSLDPAPYAAELARAQAQAAQAQARVAFTRRDFERAQSLVASGNLALRDHDSRANAFQEAEATLRAAQAAVETARLNLSYTRITAPIAGRVGRAEVTAGNLVAAGAGSPVLTNLVSVSPIYASFDASEGAVAEALAALRADGGAEAVDRIPVRLSVAAIGGERRLDGQVQMIGNVVDAHSGTVAVRARFDNADGVLMPGQFVRAGLGSPQPRPTLLISERAIGTDQDKKFVLVVGSDNIVAYRPVMLGPTVDGLRVVESGLSAGERVVVGGLGRVRPGMSVAPQTADAAAPTHLAQR